MTMPIILLCGPAGVGKDAVGIALAKIAGFKRIAQADAIKRIAKDHFGFNDEQLWGPSASRNAVDSSWVQTAKFLKLQSDSMIAAVALAVQSLSIAVGDLDVSSLSPALWGSTRATLRELAAFTEKNGGLNARIVLQLLGTEVGRAFDKLIWTRATINRTQATLDAGAPGVVVTDGRFLSEVLEFKRAGAIIWKIEGESTLTGSQHASETELNSIPASMFDVVIRNDKKAGLEALATAVDSAFHVSFSPYNITVYGDD